MYLYSTVQVRGHVFVYYGSSERSCICIVWFKWAVMYLCVKGVTFVSSYDFSIRFLNYLCGIFVFVFYFISYLYVQ